MEKKDFFCSNIFIFSKYHSVDPTCLTLQVLRRTQGFNISN